MRSMSAETEADAKKLGAGAAKTVSAAKTTASAVGKAASGNVAGAVGDVIKNPRALIIAAGAGFLGFVLPILIAFILLIALPSSIFSSFYGTIAGWFSKEQIAITLAVNKLEDAAVLSDIKGLFSGTGTGNLSTMYDKLEIAADKDKLSEGEIQYLGASNVLLTLLEQQFKQGATNCIGSAKNLADKQGREAVAALKGTMYQNSSVEIRDADYVLENKAVDRSYLSEAMFLLACESTQNLTSGEYDLATDKLLKVGFNVTGAADWITSGPLAGSDTYCWQIETVNQGTEYTRHKVLVSPTVYEKDPRTGAFLLGPDGKKIVKKEAVYDVYYTALITISYDIGLKSGGQSVLLHTGGLFDNKTVYLKDGYKSMIYKLTGLEPMDAYERTEEQEEMIKVATSSQINALRIYLNIPLDMIDAGLPFPAGTYGLSCGFGCHCSWHPNSHYGQDMCSVDGEGAPIYAVADGVAHVMAYNGGGYGNWVVINHENGIQTLYAHMSMVLVEDGATVLGGSVIGLEGTTGRSSGPHLHFELRVDGNQIDPTLMFALIENAI